jgi:glucuronate isomerase
VQAPCEQRERRELQLGRLDAEKGWTKQLHVGARRNNNTRRFHEIG